MSRLVRAGLLALALPFLYVAILLGLTQGASAALLTLKPGAIDHPLHLVGADFNQDGYDDLAMTNTQGGTVTVLINQKDGTFLIQKNSPNDVGAATVSQPTLGPLFLAAGDIDPEDVDADRTSNDVDNCPNVYNPADVTGTQADADSNGVGDACQTTTPGLDSDADGVPDYAAGVLDNCPFIANPSQEPETAKGLDGACGTLDDNAFLFGTDHLCGTIDDKPDNPKVGAACSRSTDLIVLNTRTSRLSNLGLVRVRVNDGAGGLRSRSSLQASSGAAQVALADLNGDTRLDLVVSNSATESLLFFPGANDGELGFVCLGGSNAGSLCVSSSQCPGGTCQQNQVLFTSGTCGGGQSSPVCAMSTNCPSGTFCRPSNNTTFGGRCAAGTTPNKPCLTDADCPGAGICRSPAGPEGLAVGDLNGDDRPDIVYANRTMGNVGVFLNAGPAAFAPAPGSPFTSVPGPGFTDDHPIAVLTARVPRICTGGTAPGISCTVDLNCAGGGICVGESPRICMGGATPGTPCAIDQNCGVGGVCRIRSLDGDACADPVVLMQGPLSCLGGPSSGSACLTDQDCGAGGLCTGHGRIQVFNALCPLGSLVAGQSIDLSNGHVPRSGAMVDFDRDGYLDLAVADYSGGQVVLFSGSAAGLFATTPTVTLSSLAGPVALAPLNVDPATGANLDLAVLSYTNNRVDVFHNTSTPTNLSFDPTPSFVTPWSGAVAMALFPADASIGQDLVLLQDTPPSLDVLSGTGTTFTGLQPERPEGPAGASGFGIGDLRKDGLLDLLLFDSGAPGTATPMISDLLGGQTERVTVNAVGGPVHAAIAPLTLHAGDYDQDGVPDSLDNCPTRYNPPGCPANDETNFPECFVEIPCTGLASLLTGCNNPNASGQCDNDNNGVGDQCEFLDALCLNVDTDLDGVPDYEQFTHKVDNCPWIANSGQDESDKTCTISGIACTLDADCGATGGTCKGDGVGDTCDSSTCVLGGGSGFCDSGPKENGVCRSDADCDAGVNDAVLVDRPGGNLKFLIGDASGGLRQAPAAWSAIGGLAEPIGAAIDRLSYTCSGGVGGFALQCRSRPEPGILVVEQGAFGVADDALKMFVGDGLGGFIAPAPPVAASVPLQGDPTKLLVAPDQRVCPNPWLAVGDLRYHFDEDVSTSVIAIVEPGTQSLGIYLPSNEGPAPPPANPNPLPLSSVPADALFVDLNQDGILDLLALSSGDGNAATPNLTVYLGLGSGLFFTDPSINPTDVPDGTTLLAAGHVNISADLTYPDVVLFDGVNQAPLIMTNVLTERGDIDQSQRVDGFDLALLARAFGSTRGEDFILEPDGTLRQNPDLGSSPAYDPTRLVVGSGVLTEGHDLPSSVGSGFCDRALEPLAGLYGLPVDINLDGVVDGEDLAILASLFGVSF